MSYRRRNKPQYGVKLKIPSSTSMETLNYGYHSEAVKNAHFQNVGIMILGFLKSAIITQIQHPRSTQFF